MINTERLDSLAKRFDEIDVQLAHMGGDFDQDRYTKLVRERSMVEPTVLAYREYRKLLSDLSSNEQLLADRSDPDLYELAEEEAKDLRARRVELEERLTELLLPRDPSDEKDVFIEIRAGAGGDEAAIFAGDLARMYMRFAESLKMNVELISESLSDSGGYKEIVFGVRNNAPYRYFKFESGVHRVQRVPETESQGRVHTSTATVAVLPEVDEDDSEIVINPSDLQVDTYKSSGAGGQHVNKTESAIRITHLPTGIIVASQQQRSQIQNRERAMQMLRSQLADRRRQEAEESVGSLRRSQVGSGDRSEKIRTYNFPQDRLTDHRINQNFGNIRGIMEGNMSELVSRLQQDERERLLAGETTAA
jgi:peptide chain release factor 1